MTNPKNLDHKMQINNETNNLIKKNFNELKEILKNDKKDILNLLEQIEKNLKKNDESRPNMTINKKKMKEYRGMHLIWNNDRLVHWRGWIKNPNYDPVYSSSYTKIYYPNMDIYKPSYSPYLNNTKIKSYVTGTSYDDLPLGWKILPPLNFEKRIKYAESEKEHNSKVYQFIANTTSLFDEMCEDSWIISKWCKNDPIHHCSDENKNNSYSFLYPEKKPPFPYGTVSDYSNQVVDIGPPNCIMEKNLID